MYILSVPEEDKNTLNQINDLIKNKDHIFILIYMEGCGPCNATRPEWSKMSSALKQQYKKYDDVAIIDMNKDLLPFVNHIGSVEGFPTMKYITNNGNTIETYEDSAIKDKDRSSDSFINWVETKILKNKIIPTASSSSQNVYRRIRKGHSNSINRGSRKKRQRRKSIRNKSSRKSRK